MLLLQVMGLRMRIFYRCPKMGYGNSHLVELYHLKRNRISHVPAHKP